MKCIACGLNHAFWAYEGFKKMPVTEQQSITRQDKLCHRGLGNKHFGNGCLYKRMCYQRFREQHNHPLHGSEMMNQEGAFKTDAHCNNSILQKPQQKIEQSE